MGRAQYSCLVAPPTGSMTELQLQSLSFDGSLSLEIWIVGPTFHLLLSRYPILPSCVSSFQIIPTLNALA